MATSLLVCACELIPDHLQTPQRIISSPTPTVTGTWETVIEGLVYDQSAGPNKPITGATVTYDVLHSYFPELQEGRLNRAISNQGGEFSFDVMVHDTDSVSIVVEAQGYIPYEERFLGIDLLAGKRLEVGLTPR
jgi:hypothetical protein